MPGKFTDKNNGRMAGHADKWSYQNRRPNSHDAGNGDHASKNQGTGIQGKENTVASSGIDTSNMNKEQKLKYFQQLGLMPAQEKLTIKNWPDKIREIFKDEPIYFKDIVAALKSTPPKNYKHALEAGLHATKNLEDPEDTYSAYETILNAINNINENIQVDEERTNLQQLQDVLSKMFTPDYVDAFLKIIARISQNKREQAINRILQSAIESKSLPREEALKAILSTIKLFK